MKRYSLIQIPEKYNLEKDPKVGIVIDSQNYQYPTEYVTTTEEFMTILFSDSIEKWVKRITEDEESEWFYIDCIIGPSSLHKRILQSMISSTRKTKA